MLHAHSPLRLAPPPCRTQVENPIPFLPDATSRALSTAHLHARYAWLLLWPRRLSADWSFPCVPLVDQVSR